MSQKSEKIPALRNKINEIDRRLIELLAERRAVSQDVVRVKDRGDSPIRDFKREEELLVQRIHHGRQHGLDAHYVTRIFHEIIDDSVRLQQEYLQSRLNDGVGEPELIRVAFQGIEGAYSHLAAKKFFSRVSDRLQFLGLETFDEVITAVENGRADHAMLPIENTTSGGINEVYDLLLHTSLSIIGEEKFQVRHCLVATDDVPLASLRRVYSHPQAVTQCRDFLGSLAGCEIEYFTDTAMSVSKIKEDGDPTQAAIASEEAAKMFGLRVLRRDIANQKENFTRFLVASRQPRLVDSRIPCKTSLVMATGQKPGALVESLMVFRANGINLTKLESRPILGNPWEEMFYIDLEGNIAEQKVKDALEEVTRTTRFIRVLGSYPSQDLPRTTPSPKSISTESSLGADAGEKADGSTAAPVPDSTPPRNSTRAVIRTGEKNDRDDSSCRLVSRVRKAEDTVIDVRGVKIGGTDFIVAAGPRRVESREQILACARAIKEHGGQLLRGSCSTRATSPRGAQVLDEQALAQLAEAGEAYGLPVITEVSRPEDVSVVARRADILAIGAGNMQNLALLGAVGRVHRAVLLERGPMATIDEFLQAAEQILVHGNQQVILCESGSRRLDTTDRATLDLLAVPILGRRTHLPVVVDASCAAGDGDFVPPLALAACAVGARGVSVEVDLEPGDVTGEARQALNLARFHDLVKALHDCGPKHRKSRRD